MKGTMPDDYDNEISQDEGEFSFLSAFVCSVSCLFEHCEKQHL